jgi:hypothetical protein
MIVSPQEKKSNRTSLASEKSVAIILCTQSTWSSFFEGSQSISISWMPSTLLVKHQSPRFHYQWWFGPVIPYWLIRTISEALSTNPLSSVYVHSVALTPSCRHLPVCHKQLHELRIAKMLRCTTISHAILGQPVCYSSVWPTWLFWALQHMETCLLLITYSLYKITTTL